MAVYQIGVNVNILGYINNYRLISLYEKGILLGLYNYGLEHINYKTVVWDMWRDKIELAVPRVYY